VDGSRREKNFSEIVGARKTERFSDDSAEPTTHPSGGGDVGRTAVLAQRYEPLENLFLITVSKLHATTVAFSKMFLGPTRVFVSTHQKRIRVERSSRFKVKALIKTSLRIQKRARRVMVRVVDRRRWGNFQLIGISIIRTRRYEASDVFHRT